MSEENDVLARLQPHAFEGIAFPAIEDEIEGGHDGVEHGIRGKRGTETEPTGLRAYHGQLIIACLDGLDDPWNDFFTENYVDLIAKFEENPIGRLDTHLNGTFDAFIGPWVTKTNPGTRNGVILTLRYREHNATAALAIRTRSANDVAQDAVNANAAFYLIRGDEL